MQYVAHVSGAPDLMTLTLTVPVTTIDALRHFETGELQHSARGWGK